MGSTLYIKVGLLISLAVLGWLVGRRFKVDPKDISSLLVYVISPFVIFISIIDSPADISFFRYSLAAFLLSSGFAGLAYLLGKLLWNDSKANLFSFAGGTGNTGYFALPVVLSLFSSEYVAVAIFIIIGVNLYEFTVGYYITAKGKFSNAQCCKKVLSLPIIYAALSALTLKVMSVSLGSSVSDFMNNFKGAYSVLGMMVIGMTLSKFTQLRVDWKFSFASIGWKHLCIPILGALILHQFTLDSQALMVMMLMLATPMAGNVVVIANQLDVHPEVAASTVMMSTLVALFSVPVSIQLINALS
ncbi:AEC family transporter [Endozoicomonas numazuensis]|uniref:Transporter n=1 Tax=Endozoicomonas numazuensis TaxID=1137799 RepID=A0A081ND54_9GAMM|nr:AEC family transporter [Endozoicomonas numazuensis]KEQ16377.1 transporter [Endozoicomonas numazuensis]